MANNSLRLTYLFAALVFALLNCSFSSVDVNKLKSENNTSIALAHSPGAKPSLKKFSLKKRVGYVLSLKQKKGKGGLIALVVFGALVTAFLLAAVVFLAAWGGGSSTLLTIVAIGGLALIVFGAVRLIRGIKRKRGTATG